MKKSKTPPAKPPTREEAETATAFLNGVDIGWLQMQSDSTQTTPPKKSRPK